MKKRRRKGTQKRNRLLAVLAASMLVLLCLLADCYKKGLFSRDNNKFTQQQKESVRENVSEQSGRDQKNIRVLLTDTAMGSIFHERVEVTGSAAFTVERNGDKKEYPEGKVVSFTQKDMKSKKQSIVIRCPQGKIKVCSILRRGEVPSYSGVLELAGNAQGILLINELSLREYLYGVLPSEMSASYPLETLKAQAVCARSFAWKQMQSKRYQKYDADVDDTTDFQVYGMATAEKKIKKAVDETSGEMLFHNKKVITAYYYSTSWGCSATTEEVWGGGESPECYSRKLQVTEESQKTTGISNLNLADSKILESFLSKELCDTYDSHSSWYRWRTEISAKELGARWGLGRVKKLEVVERTKSGLVVKLRMVGTKGQKVVSGQQEVRETLMTTSCRIQQQDGNTQQLSMFPSAAFYIKDSMKEGKVWFQIRGGGFGHGVGMSQNGAAGMADAGYDYREILNHYYKECTIR